MTRSVRGLTCAAALWCVPLALRGQTPADTTKPYPLPPLTVSVTRAELPLSKVPLSVHTVDRAQISRAKPTWGLDEALPNVPGVFVAARFDLRRVQRLPIRPDDARPLRGRAVRSLLAPCAPALRGEAARPAPD